MVAEFKKDNHTALTMVMQKFDLVRDTMNTKWGINNLKFLVDIDIRQKFEAQEKLLVQADENDVALQIQRYEAMIRAYTYLDRVADEANMPQIHEHIIEGKTDDGYLFRIVPDGQHYYADEIATFTTTEIAKLLNHSNMILEFKSKFPRSHIKEIRNKMVEDDLEDEIPF
tara:strand:- start:409 stop:918 length:510 start_codon:yes stop_codon:yes gene_type:complete